jgi:hypothetical protein
MSKFTSTGIVMYCGVGQPATLTEAAYDAIATTKIGELTTIPSFGPTITVVESKPLETGVTEKHIGFINYGSLALEADYDDEDAGQSLITDAVDFNHVDFGKTHSIKLVYKSGAIRYWFGKFFSADENPGSADSMVTTSMLFEINSTILKVPAP